MLTGTTEPFTFEGMTDEEIGTVIDYKAGNIAPLNNPLKNDANNSDKVVGAAVETASWIQLITKSEAGQIRVEAGRPVSVDFLYVGDNTAGTAIFWYNQSWKGQTRNQLLPATEDWTQFSDKITLTVDAAGYLLHVNPKTHMYFDDYSIIPDYKITYHKNDGSSSSEWYSGKNTSYTPSKDNFNSDILSQDGGLFMQIGWSTEQNAEVPMTSVALANEDVELYPVFEAVEQHPLTVDGSSFVNAKNGSVSIRYDGSEPVWTVDKGNTNCDIAENGNVLTLTATGYNGVATVTAVADGVKRTVSVQFIGSVKKARPGLNMLTGTTDSFTFEGMTDDEIGWVINYTGGNIAPMDNTVQSEANRSKRIVGTSEASGSSWHQLITAVESDKVRVEAGRPVSVKLLYISDATDTAAFWCNTSWKDMQKNLLAATADWTPYSNQKLVLNADATGYLLHTHPKTHIYFDDYSIVPYYKVTYVNENDEVLASEYVLYGTDGKLLTSYAPKKSLLPNADLIAAISTEKGGANIDSVALANEDITLYVTYHDLSPKNTEEYGIRLGAVRGMRMTSFVSALQRSFADEYGFLVALDSSFTDGDYSALVFPDEMKGNTALAEGKTSVGLLADGTTKFIYATAYDKASGADIHKVGKFGDEDGFLINAVIINISDKDYRTNFAVRPYLRVGDSYFYGDVMVKSIKDVAESLDDAYKDSLSDEDFEYIDAILGA